MLFYSHCTAAWCFGYYTRGLELNVVCAQLCKKLWADLWSKARLRQKQTMDHCSGRNKHLAVTQQTGQGPPLDWRYPRMTWTGRLMETRWQGRKNNGQWRRPLTEPTGGRAGSNKFSRGSKFKKKTFNVLKLQHKTHSTQQVTPLMLAQ